MTLVWHLTLFLLLASTATAEIPAATCAAGQTKTVVILVRHADRDGEELNAKGWARALALRDLVFGEFADVDAVLYTDYVRTRQTLEPIVEQVKTIGRDVPQLSRAGHDYAGFAESIRTEHARGRPLAVLVLAGHSNTLRPILQQFRPDQIHADEWFPCDGDVCHWDYDDLWTITLCGNAPPEIRKGTFGAPTLEP